MDATSSGRSHHREPWNKGKLVGQKAPFKPKDVWAMRARLQQEHRTRELALLILGIDSKLRGCDLVASRVRDLQHGGQLAPRAIVTQHKTGRPVQFEITPPTRAAVQAWILEARLKPEDYLSRAGSIVHPTSARGSTRECCASGCATPISTGRRTARTRSAGRRPR
jgi:hypothetical protein